MRYFTRKNLRRLLRLFILAAMGAAAVAADRGSTAEAKAMLMKAIAHYKAVGRQQALADFTAEKPPFRDRDLYVVCIDRELRVSANGAFPDYVYVPADILKAANGEGVGTVAWRLTGTMGQAMVRYRWVNPATHRMEWKIGYFARVGEDVCGVGVYSPE
jgi:cytochrome c